MITCESDPHSIAILKTCHPELDEGILAKKCTFSTRLATDTGGTVYRPSRETHRLVRYCTVQFSRSEL